MLVGTMKTKLLLVALIATSILIPAALRADRVLVVPIGDKPFYTHGERYWDGDYEMIWVPGHITLGSRWVHGYYVRGEHRKHDVDKQHDDRKVEHRDNDRR